jgi:uncharacterized protein (TIGR02996 family)
MSTAAALLAAIAAHPDDDTARLVYADFLDEQGSESDSARAALVRAQVELARPAQRGEATKRRELLALAKRLLKKHGTEWAAPVFDALGTPNDKYRRHLDYNEWDRGFLAHLTFENVAALRARGAAVAALTPLCEIGLRAYTDADVIALAAEPLLQGVSRVRLFGDARNNGFGDEAAAALAASPHLAGVREFDLTQNRLTTTGVRALAHSPHLTNLARLRLYGNAVNDETYAMLVASPLAARMTAWEVNGRFEVTDGAARALAAATHLTHITKLSFDNTRVGDAGAEALCAAPHLASVRELDFYNSSAGAGAAAAVARAPVFADLERLSFEKSWIGSEGSRALCRSKYAAVPDSCARALTKRFGRAVAFGRT